MTMKARRKSDGEIIEVREWRGASDVIYSSPDMNRFYQASELDFDVDADAVIQGWVCRDKEWNKNIFLSDLFLAMQKPRRDGEMRYGMTWASTFRSILSYSPTSHGNQTLYL